MAPRVFLSAFLLAILSLSQFSTALYEDQVGVADWHRQYIGKVKHAVFHTQKAGRKRVIVSTEENVIASLDLRRGEIFWRRVLGEKDIVDHIDIALGKYIITLSSEGGVVRAWNLPDGQMVWETVLQVSIPSESMLSVTSNIKKERENLVLVSGGGWLHAVSSLDGEIIWSKDFASEGFKIVRTYESTGGDILYALGLSGSSKVDAFQISMKNGEVLKHITTTIPGELSEDIFYASDDIVVALDTTKRSLFLISFRGGEISFHQTYVSDLAEDLTGPATILHSKIAGMVSLKINSWTVMVKVKGVNDIAVVERIKNYASISDALVLPEGKHAFAVIQHKETKIHLNIKLNDDLENEVLSDSIRMDQERGHVQKVFINNYVRADRTNGFRALLVMEDHSLLLVQQGEIVWSREDGLASIIDSISSDLPVEKDGGSVAKVEHNLFEWLKGHFLKLKGTLLLASADDLATIQEMRLKNSEKNKMTRDHNGFRKLLIVLTKAGKIFALHTGDGRIVWSLLPSSLQRSESCQHPHGLYVYQWQVPHHHAMDANPSIFVVGRCGPSPSVTGTLAVIDSYTGKEIKSMHVSHSVVQVLPLPYTDKNEQRLHIIIDSNNYAHLYPKTSDSLRVFREQMQNIYWYTVEAERNTLRGYSITGDSILDEVDEYCFRGRQLWSVVLPSETEKIVTTTTRQLNEVVHTQAKPIGDKDVMYKYISKNVLFVATVAPEAVGEIGSVNPDEAWLVAYLIDTVTGRVLHRVTHHGAQGPVHVVFSENWVVYHYFNLRAHRYEMAVIEIYDETRAGNKDVLKLMFGKHNLTSPVSSYSWPEISVKSQTYFFTHSVRAMAVTSTAKGITSKQLLIGTIGDQVLALDKRFLDPRRTANPSQSEREEGIIPLTDALPIFPQAYLTHSLQVAGLRAITTIPAKLESTTLIFSYGVDLFFTRFAPSKTYDSLTEDFNYALLLITIIALVVAILVTWILSEQKELRDRWR